MIGFRCIPMDTGSAIRFRQTGCDDAGNPLHRRIADHPAPCRHCLAESQIGVPVLLGSYHFGRPHGVYWTPSPIFLHAEPRERFAQVDFVPEIVRHRLVSARVYDADTCASMRSATYATAPMSSGCWIGLWLIAAPITSTFIRRDRAVFCAESSGYERTVPQLHRNCRRAARSFA
jgi:hypothetical protein